MVKVFLNKPREITHGYKAFILILKSLIEHGWGGEGIACVVVDSPDYCIVCGNPALNDENGERKYFDCDKSFCRNIVERILFSSTPSDIPQSIDAISARLEFEGSYILEQRIVQLNTHSNNDIKDIRFDRNNRIVTHYAIDPT